MKNEYREELSQEEQFKIQRECDENPQEFSQSEREVLELVGEASARMNNEELVKMFLALMKAQYDVNPTFRAALTSGPKFNLKEEIQKTREQIDLIRSQK